jgi:cytochrome c-type biogenesis protein
METSIGYNVTVGLAFLAGLASFLSPCVFPLVPAYIGYLSGRSIATYEDDRFVNRFSSFLHGLAFVIGFSSIFILMGAIASSLGFFLNDLLENIKFWLARVGGIIVVLFGLHMAGILRIPFLDYDLRPKSQFAQNRSYLSSFLMGIFFSAGWTPCVGPVLGTILTFAVNGGDIIQGVVWLSSYSAGLAIPFLLAALSIGWVAQVMGKYRKQLHYIEVAMGVVLVIVGAMLCFGVFGLLASFGNLINFGL